MSHIIYLTIIVILIAVIVLSGRIILIILEDFNVLEVFERELRSAEDDIHKLRDAMPRKGHASELPSRYPEPLIEDVRIYLEHMLPAAVYVATAKQDRTGQPIKIIGYTLNSITAEKWAREGLKVSLRSVFMHNGHVYFRDAFDTKRITKLEP